MTSETILPSGGSSQSALGEQKNVQTNVQNNVQIQNGVDVSTEQNRYANILSICSWTGIGVMVITFFLYILGLFSPLIDPSEMPRYWGMTVHQYALATHPPTGWTWLGSIDHADYMSLVGLAFLGTVSILGYLSLIIDYLRKKDFPYVMMVGLEIVVIVLAASGIFRPA